MLIFNRLILIFFFPLLQCPPIYSLKSLSANYVIGPEEDSEIIGVAYWIMENSDPETKHSIISV